MPPRATSRSAPPDLRRAEIGFIARPRGRQAAGRIGRRGFCTSEAIGDGGRKQLYLARRSRAGAGN
jgi:hypothetical protein